MRREINYDEVFDAQQHFRTILDSMARPGKVNSIHDTDVLPPQGLNRGAALVALALLNADVTYNAVNNDDISEYLAINTNAAPVAVEEADFVFIEGNHDAEIIYQAKTGTLSYPEEGATFVISVEEIDAAATDALEITLKGPGIETTNTVSIKGLNPQLLTAAREQNMEFPLGVDLIIIDKTNRIVCIPRSNQFTVCEAEAEVYTH